jgi:hypothetical protein
VDTMFTGFVFVKVYFLGGDVFWGLSSGALSGGYGVPYICGTICILFRPYLASCGDDV